MSISLFLKNCVKRNPPYSQIVTKYSYSKTYQNSDIFEIPKLSLLWGYTVFIVVIPWIILIYNAKGAVVKRMTKGCPENKANASPPNAWAKIVFWTVIFPPVVPSLRLPKAMEGKRQAKYRKTVVEITFEIDFKSLTPSTKSEIYHGTRRVMSPHSPRPKWYTGIFSTPEIF